jgi:hypothetical protein
VTGQVAWTVLAGILASGPGSVAMAAEAPVPIPAFSRLYRTSCSTCHVTPGKLNSQGEAFRLNGYRFPDDGMELRQDDPVPLGAEPWKELWPGSIWPGEIPGGLPLSLHLANDLHVARAGDGRTGATFLFPAVVNLQAATSLGGGMAAFAEVGWRGGGGLQVGEVKVKIQDPLPWLPPRALNLWVGAQRPHLLTFGDPTLDRAARQPFLWQWFRLSDWELDDRHGDALVSDNTFRLAGVRPAIELTGLVRGRFQYGTGLAQSGAAAGGERRSTDVYVKLRQKLAGARLDGRATPGAEPRAWGGQLLDDGLTLEQFAYVGEVRLGSGEADRHRTLGGAARLVLGRADMGIGHVRGRNSGPWGDGGPEARHTSTFTRGEYLVYPWLVASLKADHTEYRAAASDPTHAGYARLRRARLLPAAVVLLRHNVRAIAEGELFVHDDPRSGPGTQPPHALWIRLDLAY